MNDHQLDLALVAIRDYKLQHPGHPLQGRIIISAIRESLNLSEWADAKDVLFALQETKRLSIMKRANDIEDREYSLFYAPTSDETTKATSTINNYGTMAIHNGQGDINITNTQTTLLENIQSLRETTSNHVLDDSLQKQVTKLLGEAETHVRKEPSKFETLKGKVKTIFDQIKTLTTAVGVFTDPNIQTAFHKIIELAKKALS